MKTARSMTFLLALAQVTACGGSGNSKVVANYAEIAEASYADSIETAETLDAAIQALVADPTEANLTAAREAWIDSREPYLQTEVYRFYDGPIDNPEDGPEGGLFLPLVGHLLLAWR